MSALAAATASPARPPGATTVERRALGGGCHLLLVHDDSVPLVHLHVSLGAGVDREPAGGEGLASASVELLPLPAERAALDARGSDLLAGVGWTSASVAVESLSDELPAALGVLEALLARDDCAPEALARWVGRRRAALAGMASAASRLADLALARSVAGTRREGLARGGTRRTVARLTVEDVAHFRRAVRRFPWTVTAVGSFTAEPLARRVAGWPRPSGGWADAVAAIPPSGARSGGFLVDVPAAERAEVRFGCLVGAHDAGEMARLRLLARLVGTRLQRELRQSAGLTYGVRARVRRRRAASLWSLGAAVEPTAVGRTLAAIDGVLAAVAAAPPSELEVDRTRRAHLAATLIARESLGGLAAAVAVAHAGDDELEGVETTTGEDLQRLALRVAASGSRAVAGPGDRLRGRWRGAVEPIAVAELLDGPLAGEGV